MYIKLTIDDIFRFLLVSAIVIVPLLSYGEVLALIRGTLRSQTESITPIYIKLIKDVIMLLLLLLSTVKVLIKRSVSVKSFITLFVILSIISMSFVYSSGLSLMVLAAGLRWSIPLFLIAAFIYFRATFQYKPLFIVVCWIYGFHLFAQVYQFLFAGHWFGSYFGVYSLRNPGLFLIPGTGALFSICCFLCIYEQCISRAKRFLLSVSVFLSVVLTLSGTGLIILFSLMLIILFQKFFSNIISMLIFCFISVLSLPGIVYLSAFLGRGENYIAISGGDRIEIFYEIIERVSFFSSYFGIGTNSGVLAASTLGHETNSVTVDSMFTSVLMNTGFLGFTVFLVSIAAAFFSAISTNNQNNLRVSLVILLASFTSIWTEAYPVNLIFAIMLAEVFNSRGLENENLQYNRVHS